MIEVAAIIHGVIPAKAGIHSVLVGGEWIPAFAGMTLRVGLSRGVDP